MVPIIIGLATDAYAKPLIKTRVKLMILKTKQAKISCFLAVVLLCGVFIPLFTVFAESGASEAFGEAIPQDMQINSPPNDATDDTDILPGDATDGDPADDTGDAANDTDSAAGDDADDDATAAGQDKNIPQDAGALLFGAKGFGGVVPLSVGDPELTDKAVAVVGIPEGGIIDVKNNINLTVSFGVPVIGDGSGSYFEYGEEVELPLCDSFVFASASEGAELPLTYEGIQVGTVYLENQTKTIDGVGRSVAVARIVFNGEEKIFNPDLLPDGESPYAGVRCNFTAELSYNGYYEPTGEDGRTLVLLDKTYTLRLPGDVITHEVTKTGVIEGAYIKWTVTLKGEKDTLPDPAPIDLEGYTFPNLRRRSACHRQRLSCHRLADRRRSTRPDRDSRRPDRGTQHGCRHPRYLHLYLHLSRIGRALCHSCEGAPHR